MPRPVEPDQHCRINDHRVGQRPEISPAQPALGGVLTRHQLRAADLGNAGGEMTVLIPRLARRVAAAVNAHHAGCTTYLECGVPHP
jgi:hypothetical protein